MRNPIWLSKEETRTEKYHSSILIHLPDQDMAKIALSSKVILAGKFCWTQKYIPKYTQCAKCQEYGHTRVFCRNETRCQICAQNYELEEHNCQICQINGQECPHQIAKCANCEENHKANDKKCREWEKVKPRFIRPKAYKPRSHSNSNSIDIKI